ncbi:MAG: hypothetical protein JWL83_1563 [Actinomycetia bacterium]|jgi:hypothetical protein|nr:hypothetical protein [Actinomycetes bacterium]
MSGTGQPSTATKGTGQLRLLEGDKRRPEWDLDDQTRQIGLQGIAAVRETLRRAHPPEPIRKAS